MIRFVISFLIFSFIGCSKLEDPQTLNLRLRQDLTTLDPAFIVDLDGGRVASKLFNGLVRYDENLQIVGDLAQSWSVSEDGLIYRFNLRSGVVFSNGRELEAEDVRYTFERILEEKTLSPRRWTLDKIDSIETRGKQTVEICLKEPYTPFLSLLTLPSAFIVPREEVERVRPSFARLPVGTGPFILKEWKDGTEIILERNPRYFAGPAGVERLRYRILPEDFTAVSEFERGRIDLMEIPRADFKHYLESEKWKGEIVSQTGLNTYYLGFNCSRPPFNRVELRRAVSRAVHREALLAQVLESRGELSCGPVPPILTKKLSPVEKNQDYNPQETQNFFAQAGIPLPLRAKLYFNQDKESLAIVSYIKEEWARAGLEIELVNRDWSAFKEAINKGEADCFLLSWWADTPEVENFLFPTFHSRNFGGGGNRAFYSNPAVDEWLEAAQRSASQAERNSLYGKAVSQIVEDAPWVFLWHRKDFYVHQPWVKNFRLYPIYTMEKGTELELARE